MSYEPTTTMQISYVCDKRPFKDQRTTYTITLNRKLTEEKAIALLQAANGRTYVPKAHAKWFEERIESVTVDPTGEKATIVIVDPYKD